MLTIADTAYSIATIRAEETERPRAEQLFEDPCAKWFAAAGAHAAEGTQRYLSLLGSDDFWRRYLPGEPHPNAFVANLGVAVV